jgi:hypothetical protein
LVHPGWRQREEAHSGMVPWTSGFGSVFVANLLPAEEDEKIGTMPVRGVWSMIWPLWIFTSSVEPNLDIVNVAGCAASVMASADATLISS